LTPNVSNGSRTSRNGPSGLKTLTNASTLMKTPKVLMPSNCTRLNGLPTSACKPSKLPDLGLAQTISSCNLSSTLSLDYQNCRTLSSPQHTLSRVPILDGSNRSANACSILSNSTSNRSSWLLPTTGTDKHLMASWPQSFNKEGRSNPW
jgi:hypothetical protein